MEFRFARENAVRLTLAMMLGGTGASAAAQSNDPSPKAGGACTRTAQSAAVACRSQAEADFWLGIGKCQNARDDRRARCVDRVGNAQDEAAALCRQQLDAREDLCDAVGEAAYDPSINPRNFVRTIDNPFYPLIPGTRFIYRAATEDGVERIVIAVKPETETILGVRCTVVRDTVTLDGELVEDTIDWFAQDRQGSVWYFGEISKSYEDGRLVSLDGSWRAGVDGAKPGIVMKAEPRVGDAYRQEFLLGVAEDYAKVISLNGRASVPAGSCDRCVLTRDLVPLEPDANERKFYKRGVGFILEIDEPTGDRVELVRVERP